MSKKRWIRNIAVTVVLGVVFIGLAANTVEPRQNLTLAEKGLRVAASPFQYLLSTVDNGIQNAISFFTEKGELQKENDALKQEISLLNNQINELRTASQENIRLKELLDYKNAEAGRYTLTMAKILAENNSNLQHTVTLDKGSNDGLVSGMTVMNHQGLIGRISVVLPNTSEVILLTDRESAVGARVWETRETFGVVEGNGNDITMLQLIHLPHDADIYVGDDIVSSGLDTVFPAGIHIGEVRVIEYDTNGLTKTAYIRPYVNFAKLEEVFVLLSSTEGSMGQ